MVKKPTDSWFQGHKSAEINIEVTDIDSHKYSLMIIYFSHFVILF